MLKRRHGLTCQEYQACSLEAQRRFLHLPEYGAAKGVALYAEFDNEIGTTELFYSAISAGKRVVFPAVVDNAMVFRQVSQLTGLRPGYGGILEPIAAYPEVGIKEIDLFVVPGVAFDKKGNRIGYGKGFYDKTLHSLEGIGRLVGLCHDFQLVSEITGEPHDVTMDLVVTDKRVIRTRG
jgi:5-formyltetrahydrofolate cyclo-ligase